MGRRMKLFATGSIVSHIVINGVSIVDVHFLCRFTHGIGKAGLQGSVSLHSDVQPSIINVSQFRPGLCSRASLRIQRLMHGATGKEEPRPMASIQTCDKTITFTSEVGHCLVPHDRLDD